MTRPDPIPCRLCGRPVVDIGAITWDRSRSRPDYVTALHAVCKECAADPQARELLDPRLPEVAH
jgi:hypothetical protein